MARHSLHDNANAAADFIRRTGAEISAKGVSLDGVVPIDYPELIRKIGTGDVPVPPEPVSPGTVVPTVRYIDYDGTVLLSVPTADYSNAPQNPNHSDIGLVFQGWNADLTNINRERSYDVGAMYITVDGKSHFHIRMTRVIGLTQVIYLNKNNTATLSIDWGDGVVSTVSTSGNFSSSHTYSDYGDYVVKTWISSGTGTYAPGQGITGTPIFGLSTDARRNALVSAYLGQNVTAIGASAFSNCCSLSSITIPSGVKTIGTNVFQHCYSLTSITIPDGVTTIGDATFSYCYTLKSIAMPNGVTAIGASAFYYCYSLTSIVLPNSVITIGDTAFPNCYSLTSIIIPDGVKSIGANVFQACYSLMSITIPNSVTSIGNNAFQNCYSLTSLTIPSSVKTFGSNVFVNNYTPIIYIFNHDAPPKLGATAFDGINAISKIYVPDESVEAYKAAATWSAYANYIYPMSSLS